MIVGEWVAARSGIPRFGKPSDVDDVCQDRALMHNEVGAGLSACT